MSNKVLARNIQSIYAKSMINLFEIFVHSYVSNPSSALFQGDCPSKPQQWGPDDVCCFPQGLGGFEGEFLGCKGHTVDACGTIQFLPLHEWLG